MEPTSDPAPSGTNTPPPSPTPQPKPNPPTLTPAPDPEISQIPVNVNKTETPPPPFTPSAQPEPPSPLPTRPAPSTSPSPQPSASAPMGIPSLPPEPGSQPQVTVGGSLPDSGAKVFTASAPSANVPGRRLKLPKRTLMPLIALLVVIVGAAAFYFGYYQNPSVIYSQSLSNTGKGYSKLVDYIDKQSKAENKGYTGSGGYKFNIAGLNADGQISYKSNSQNSDLSFDIGASATRVNTDIRSIKSIGSEPDIYLKFSGIKGLGTTFGDASLDPKLAKLDGRWIFIDHTLIENLTAASRQDGNSQTSTPSRDQVLDEAQAFGKVNQQYLFTTSKDKAVTKVVKKYGKETVDGHKTYHYKVALQPDHVKQYIQAQRNALLNSKLDDWIKKNHYETSTSNYFDDAANSAQQIKSSDTFDVWMDTSHRVIYKIRVSDPSNSAENYVDLGLDYKGGDDYPFFIKVKSKDASSNSTTDFSFITSINTKTHSTGFKFNEQLGGGGAASGSISANLNLQPNTAAPTIEKPANAIQLSQALSELGLDSLFNSGSSSSSSTNPPLVIDNKISNDSNAVGTLNKLFNNLAEH